MLFFHITEVKYFVIVVVGVVMAMAIHAFNLMQKRIFFLALLK